jgi:hypothetical protein
MVANILEFRGLSNSQSIRGLQAANPTGPNSDQMYNWIRNLFFLDPNRDNYIPAAPDTSQIPFSQSPYAQRQRAQGATDSAFVGFPDVPRYFRELSPQDQATLNKAFGEVIPGELTMAQVIEWLDRLLAAAALNPGGASSTLEQLTAARALIIRVQTSEIQTKILTLRRLDLYYKKKAISQEQYALLVRGNINEIQAMQIQLDRLSVGYAKIANRYNLASLKIDIERQLVSREILNQTIQRDLAVAQNNLSSLRFNAQTATTTVQNQIVMRDYIFFGIIDNAQSGFLTANAQVRGAQGHSPGKIPRFVGVALSDQKRDELQDALFPFMRYRKTEGGSFVRAQDERAGYLTPTEAGSATQVQQDRISRGMAAMSNLSGAEQKALGISVSAAAAEIKAINELPPTQLNPNTYQGVIAKRLPARLATIEDFNLLKKAIESNVSLQEKSPQLIQFIRKLNVAQFKFIMISAGIQGTLNQSGKAGAILGMFGGPFGVGAGFAGGMIVQAFIEKFAGQVGYIPQTWAQFANSWGQFIRGEAVLATEINRLEAIEAYQIGLAQDALNRDAFVLGENRSNMSEAELKTRMAAYELRAKALDEQRASLDILDQRLQANQQSLVDLRRTFAVGQQSAELAIASSEGTREQAIMNLRIAKLSKEQTVFNNNIRIGINSGIAYNNEVARIYLIYGGPILARTEYGLLIKPDTLAQARDEIQAVQEQAQNEQPGSVLAARARAQVVELDDARVLALAAARTNREFAGLYPEAWQIMSEGNGRQRIGNLVVRFLNTGEIGNAGDYSPFTDTSNARPIADTRLAVRVVYRQEESDGAPVSEPAGRSRQPQQNPGSGLPSND